MAAGRNDGRQASPSAARSRPKLESLACVKRRCERIEIETRGSGQSSQPQKHCQLCDGNELYVEESEHGLLRLLKIARN
jgi:hypothetical protein